MNVLGKDKVMGNGKESEEDGKLKGAYEDFKKTIRETLTDIVTLEVNSVLVSEISAGHPKNDDDREYLCQTCESLITWFKKNETDKVVQQPLNGKILVFLKELDKKFTSKKTPIKCDKALYAEIYKCRKEQYNNRSEYRRYLEYLQDFLVLYNTWCVNKELTSRDRQQLRKLWELVDTKYIYAQTVMELDGDVVSSINEQLFREAGDNAEELMRFHSRNVEAGSNYRNGLIDTFVKIIRAILGIK